MPPLPKIPTLYQAQRADVAISAAQDHSRGGTTDGGDDGYTFSTDSIPTGMIATGARDACPNLEHEFALVGRSNEAAADSSALVVRSHKVTERMMLQQVLGKKRNGKVDLTPAWRPDESLLDEAVPMR